MLQKINKHRRIPLFHLAVWITRNLPFPDTFTRQDVVAKFKTDYKLKPAELNALFDVSVSSAIDERKAFQEVPVGWNDIIVPYDMPPDVNTETEALLAFIGLQSLGPIAHLECRPATRLNLITGDNGVGKTFLLDSIWWALTNDWVEFPIAPRASTVFSSTPSITYQLAGAITHRPLTSLYDTKKGWSRVRDKDVIRSLVLYSRSDGAFAVWDPLRYQNNQVSSKLDFERKNVWFGKDGLSEGLLRDLVTWTKDEDPGVNDLFVRTLARLSPPEMKTLTLGTPVRLPGFSQLIPTLQHSYGEVPIVFESAGIKRMVAMAYLVLK